MGAQINKMGYKDFVGAEVSICSTHCDSKNYVHLFVWSQASLLLLRVYEYNGKAISGQTTTRRHSGTKQQPSLS